MLESAVSRIQGAESQGDAFGHFNDSMVRLGFNSATYSLLTDHPSIGEKASHGFAASYPQDWIAHYKARQYHLCDPIWQTALSGTVPFFWNDVMARAMQDESLSEHYRLTAERMINEAAEAGLADGIGLSFASPRREMAGIALSRAKGERKRRYEDLGAVMLLATFFHEKFMSFYKKPDFPPLTPRERDVLLWAAENKSDTDIGHILDVSAATVRFHWKNIFSKLEVSGRLPAVMKALQYGLITPQIIATPYQGR